MRTPLDVTEYLTERVAELHKDAEHAAALGQDEDASVILTVAVHYIRDIQAIRDAFLDALTDTKRHQMEVWK
jgi:hypothetical protein